MAEQYQVPHWGILPLLDPILLLTCEQGKLFVEEYPNTPAPRALKGFCDRNTSQLGCRSTFDDHLSTSNTKTTLVQEKLLFVLFHGHRETNSRTCRSVRDTFKQQTIS